MQQVITVNGTLNLPAGWCCLKEGTQIKSGDKFYNQDKHEWTDVTDVDCTTTVKACPDIVIRKIDDTQLSVFIEDKNYKPRITAEMY